MKQEMKGFSTTWFEVCTVDGHPLALGQGENRFRSEEEAAAVAEKTCVEYRDTVTVKECTTTIARIFRADIKAVEG